MSSFASIKSDLVKSFKAFWSELGRLDKVALLVSFLFLLILSWILLTDRSSYLFDNGYNTIKKNLPIAVLESAEETVRHKPAEFPGWNTIRANESLYENDKIFTDQGSSAVIRLGNDSVLRLSENTLVVIGVANADKENKSPPIVVDIEVAGKRTRVNVEKADIKIQAQPNGAVAVVVESGVAKLTSSDGVQSTVSKLQKTQVDQSGRLGEVRAVKIELIAPMEGKIYRIPESKEVIQSREIRFQWSAQIPELSYRLDISKEMSFNTIVHQSKWPTVEAKWSTGGEHNGVYYWRIAAVDPQGKVVEMSEPRRFVIRVVNAPQLLLPSQNQSITLTQRISQKRDESDLEGKLLFTWHSKIPDGDFEFQLSNDSEFKNVLIHDLKATSPMSSGGLTQGRYYWRVRQKFDQNDVSPWSSINSFLLRLNQEVIQVQKVAKKLPRIDPPKLKERYKVRIKKYPTKLNDRRRSPLPGWLQQLDSWINPVAIANPPAAEDSSASVDSLSWDKVADAKGYVLEIASDSSFKTTLIRTKLSVPSYSIEALQVGHYYFRVAAIDRNGNQSEFSQVSELEVQPPIPDLLVPVDGSTFQLKDASKGVQFAWDKIPGDLIYILEISRSPNFDSIWQRQVIKKSTSHFAFEHDGSYFWRVATKSSLADDRQPLEFTAVRKLTVLPEPKPPIPPSLPKLETKPPTVAVVPPATRPPANSPVTSAPLLLQSTPKSEPVKPLAPNSALKSKSKGPIVIPKDERESNYRLWRNYFAWFSYGFGDGNYIFEDMNENRRLHKSLDQVIGLGLEIPFLDHWRGSGIFSRKNYVMEIYEGVNPDGMDSSSQSYNKPVQYEPIDLTYETTYLSAKYDLVFLKYFAVVAEGGIICNIVPGIIFTSDLEVGQKSTSIYGVAPSLGLMYSYRFLRFEAAARFVQELFTNRYAIKDYLNDLYQVRLFVYPYRFFVLGLSYEAEENLFSYSNDSGLVKVIEQSDIVKIYVGGKF